MCFCAILLAGFVVSCAATGQSCPATIPEKSLQEIREIVREELRAEIAADRAADLEAGRAGGVGRDLDGNAGGDEPGAADENSVRRVVIGVERLRVDVDSDVPMRGADDAAVTLIVFCDFQDLFCKRLDVVFGRLLTRYAGKLRIGWRHDPSPVHPYALPAAEFAVEAFMQGGAPKFWQASSLLFEEVYSREEPELSRQSLDRYARQLGLNLTRYRRAMDTHAHRARIAEDRIVAERLGPMSTPTTFINGRILEDAPPEEMFVNIIDDEIRRAERAFAAGDSRTGYYDRLMYSAHSRRPPPGYAASPSRSRLDARAIYDVPLGDSVTLGNANALVTIVLFSDFQCPFCGRLAAIFRQLREKYGDEVRIVWKDNPLAMHARALDAAIVAREAALQGGPEKFWQMHDLLFENQRDLGRASLERYAASLGLDVSRVRAALENQTHRPHVAVDQVLAAQLGATGTPASFINGRNLRGAQPFEVFTAAIDEELDKARALVRSGTPRSGLYERITAGGANAPVMIDP